MSDEPPPFVVLGALEPEWTEYRRAIVWVADRDEYASGSYVHWRAYGKDIAGALEQAETMMRGIREQDGKGT